MGTKQGFRGRQKQGKGVKKSFHPLLKNNYNYLSISELKRYFPIYRDVKFVLKYFSEAF
jgi:hypothetical protein